MIQKMIHYGFQKIMLTILLIFTLGMWMVPKTASAIDTAPQVSNIAFTSDVHGEIDNLKTWLTNLASKDLTMKLDYMVFGGDMSDEFDGAKISEMKNIVAQYAQAGNIFTMGNHEWEGLGSESAFLEAANNSRTGVQVEKQNYIIYTLGAASKKQKFSKKDIHKLDQYLLKIDRNIPIFIVSHYPLHAYSDNKKSRKTKKSKDMISVLNKYPNVIFLWGHNHSLKDKNYGTVKGIGDTLEYASGKSMRINFTYANLGCMKDGINQDVYGLLATVEKNSEDWTVKLQYRSITANIGKTITVSSAANFKNYTKHLKSAK